MDEWRAQEGLAPLAKVTGGLVDGAYVNSAFFFQQAQVRMQEIAMAAGLEAGPPGGPPGTSKGEDPSGVGQNGNNGKNGKRAEKSLRIVYVDGRDEDEDEDDVSAVPGSSRYPEE